MTDCNLTNFNGTKSFAFKAAEVSLRVGRPLKSFDIKSIPLIGAIVPPQLDWGATQTFYQIEGIINNDVDDASKLVDAARTWWKDGSYLVFTWHDYKSDGTTLWTDESGSGQVITTGTAFRKVRVSFTSLELVEIAGQYSTFHYTVGLQHGYKFP